MSSSSASHTSGEVRCSGLSASRGSRYSRTSSGRALRRLGRLGGDEALDDARQAVRGGATDDPLEQRRVLRRDLERRVPGRHVAGRVREPQEVAVGHAVSLAVLDRLVGERLHRPTGVPAADRSSQRAAPAAELLDERRELEQVRARASHPRQRLERRPARRLVAETGGHREREQRRVVLRRPALLAHARDLGDRARAVLVDAALDRLRVLARQRPLGCVVAAALGAEDQEPAQPRPIIDLPGEAAGRVRHLPGAGDRRPLRHAPRAVTLQIRHLTPPFWGAGGWCRSRLWSWCADRTEPAEAGGAAKPHLLDECAGWDPAHPRPLAPEAITGAAPAHSQS